MQGGNLPKFETACPYKKNHITNQEIKFDIGRDRINRIISISFDLYLIEG